MQSVLFLCILLLAATEWGSIATGVDTINLMVGDDVFFPFTVQHDLTDDTERIKIVVEPDDSSRTDNSYEYIFNPSPGSSHSTNNRISYDEIDQWVVMKNAALNDTGFYTITLWSDRDNKSKKTEKFRLVIHRVVEHVLKVEDTITLSNNLVKVATCDVTGPSGVEVYFAGPNNLSLQQTHFIVKSGELITHKLKLGIVPTEKYNGERLTCVVAYKDYSYSGRRNTVIFKDFYLNVEYPPKDPIITVTNNKSSLTCSADGNPTPNVILTLDDEILAYGSSPQSIDVVSSEDPSIQENEYVCHAIIPDGGKISSEPLTISQLQEILREPAKIGMIVGIVFGSLILCGVIGGLVYWFRIRKKSVGDLTV